jgi:hypothetical protein
MVFIMSNFDGSDNGNEWLRVHGHRPKGKSSPTYVTWIAMKSRCNTEFSRYSNLGISVCERWDSSFNNFIDDMGERPSGCTIDRIDPFKGYYFENCRWATNKAQARNRLTSNPVIFFGIEMFLTDIAREFNISESTIYRRNKKGYRDSDLISKVSKLKLLVGESCNGSKLSEEKVLKIRDFCAAGGKQKDAAEMFGVKQPTISGIINRKQWAHI